MPKILLVEDNEMNRDMLSRRLGRRGFTVVLAEDGQQGVDMARAERPDLILMDLSMPGVDGTEATRRIVDADPALPVVILTSFSHRERIAGALDAGAVGYLLKDAPPSELIGRIREAARPSRAA